MPQWSQHPWLAPGDLVLLKEATQEKQYEPFSFVVIKYRQEESTQTATGAGVEAVSDWLEKKPKAGSATSEPVRLDWFLAVHCGANQAAPPRAMTAMYVAIQTLLRSGRHSTVDAILSSVDTNKLPAEAMVGLLRYSFSEKFKLKRWNDLFRRIREALQTRGIAPDRALRGLM
jgi:hypothetical protein